MTNVHFFQLIGVLLVIMGCIGLAASSYLFGTPLSREEKRGLGRDWSRKGNVYRLPFNLETVASAAFLIGGLGILGWAKFDLCVFLQYWIPGLPEVIRILLACK